MEFSDCIIFQTKKKRWYEAVFINFLKCLNMNTLIEKCIQFAFTIITSFTWSNFQRKNITVKFQHLCFPLNCNVTTPRLETLLEEMKIQVFLYSKWRFQIQTIYKEIKVLYWRPDPRLWKMRDFVELFIMGLDCH